MTSRHAAKKAGLSADQRAEIDAALGAYGARLTEDDRIAKGDKVMSVQVEAKGGRLKMVGGGNVLSTYPASRASQGVSDFVEKFWFWRKDGAALAHVTKKRSPAQLQREIDEALAGGARASSAMPDDTWRWQNVRMTHRGRELLGTVRSIRRDLKTGALHLIVHHFNGERWPVEPVASKVKVI